MFTEEIYCQLPLLTEEELYVVLDGLISLRYGENSNTYQYKRITTILGLLKTQNKYHYGKANRIENC